MDAEPLWSLFDEVASAIRGAVLDAGLDPEEPGERAGQYRLDLVADRIAVDMLSGAGLSVLSEESGHHFPERDVCVVVDPVDGSTNAGRGLPHWATSLCAVDAEGPLVSTVVDHSGPHSWRSARGRGAWVGPASGPHVRITRHESPQTELAHAVLAVNGRSGVWPRMRQYRAYGSLAVELCLVGQGALDGFVNLDGDCHGPWDYLGGVLVLIESGGVVADRRGRDLVTLDVAARRDLIAATGSQLLADLGDAVPRGR